MTLNRENVVIKCPSSGGMLVLVAHNEDFLSEVIELLKQAHGDDKIEVVREDELLRRKAEHKEVGDMLTNLLQSRGLV